MAFLRPILQMASQSALDSGEAAGDVSSMYSTPKSSSAWAIFILVCFIEETERKGEGVGKRVVQCEEGGEEGSKSEQGVSESSPLWTRLSIKD